MESATNAKLDAEKHKHQDDLDRLKRDMDRMRDKLKKAEEDADVARGKMRESDRIKGKMAAVEDRAKKRDETAQATIRDLERELDEAQRNYRNKERDLAVYDNELDDLRQTVKDMQVNIFYCVVIRYPGFLTLQYRAIYFDHEAIYNQF